MTPRIHLPTASCLIRLFLFTSIALLAASCSTVQQSPDSSAEQPATEVKKKTAPRIPVGWNQEQNNRKAITRWELRGRLGVQTASNGGMMDMTWRQAGDEFSIRLIAPLGSGTTLIQGDGQYTEIRHANGQRQEIENVDEVFRKALDVDLPASALKDWVRGLPAAGMAIDKRNWNKLGLIERLQQEGWTVELKEYTGTDIQMPHAIYLGHLAQPELDIRLVLKQWLIDD